MTKVIIYKTDAGGVAIVYPTPGAVALLGIDAIAAKDVPTGKPYKIIDASELPEDRGQRQAWTVDDTVLTDGVGA